MAPSGRLRSGPRVEVSEASPSSLLSTASVAIAVVALLAAAAWTGRSRLQALWQDHISVAPDLMALKAPRLVDLPELSSSAYRSSMLWGSYRSGLYFGMRTRSPQSLLVGLMWFDPDDPDTINQRKVRHDASQNDGMATYGWLRHDGIGYGRQTLVDGNYNITVTMVKDADASSGFGGDWSVRVTVTRATTAAAHQPGAPRKQRRISVLMYIASEGAPQGAWRMLPDGEPHEDDMRAGITALSGTDAVVGPWSLHLRAQHGDSAPTTTPAAAVAASAKPWKGRMDYLAMQLEKKEHLLQLREIVISSIYEHHQRNPEPNKLSLYLPNGVNTGADVAMFQLTSALPTTSDWTFTTGGAAFADGGIAGSEALQQRLQTLSGPGLTSLMQQREAAYDERFARTFSQQPPLASQGTGLDDREDSAAVTEMAKAALSNLVGSMGYFYGSSQIRTPRGVLRGRPSALFTAVPSRSFFPRGFLWDEGFHQLLVQRWDGRASRDALAHWLDLLNAQGWIPREQILGMEAEARVPAEYVVQDPSHANPPSLFLPISNMAAELQAKGAEGAPEVHAFLQRAWPRLEAWYGWFNRTQAGQMPGTYRWHGRNATTDQELNPKTLTSGLDDYPRASHPSDDERHLDLHCWMALASESMATIGAAVLGADAAVVQRYRATSEALRDLSALDATHLDHASGQYLDWGRHSTDVSLQRRTVVEDGQNKEVAYRRVGTPPTARLVPGYGYVSLFPLLMGLLPPASEQLGRQLALLADPRLLWSAAGLRSLATDAPLYKKHNTLHDPPYWRGQVWMNINYLALRALSQYAQQEGPHSATAAELHQRLRASVLGTVVKQYRQQGYLYEQYDDTTGRGLSSHPFTGWTALAALVAVDAY